MHDLGMMSGILKEILGSLGKEKAGFRKKPTVVVIQKEKMMPMAEEDDEEEDSPISLKDLLVNKGDDEEIGDGKKLGIAEAKKESNMDEGEEEEVVKDGSLDPRKFFELATKKKKKGMMV